MAWAPITPTSETWTAVSPASETWAPVSPTSEAWAARERVSETWDGFLAGERGILLFPPHNQPLQVTRGA